VFGGIDLRWSLAGEIGEGKSRALGEAWVLAPTSHWPDSSHQRLFVRITPSRAYFSMTKANVHSIGLFHVRDMCGEGWRRVSGKSWYTGKPHSNKVQQFALPAVSEKCWVAATGQGGLTFLTARPLCRVVGFRHSSNAGHLSAVWLSHV